MTEARLHVMSDHAVHSDYNDTTIYYSSSDISIYVAPFLARLQSKDPRSVSFYETCELLILTIILILPMLMGTCGRIVHYETCELSILTIILIVPMLMGMCGRIVHKLRSVTMPSFKTSCGRIVQQLRSVAMPSFKPSSFKRVNLQITDVLDSCEISYELTQTSDISDSCESISNSHKLLSDL